MNESNVIFSTVYVFVEHCQYEYFIFTNVYIVAVYIRKQCYICCSAQYNIAPGGTRQFLFSSSAQQFMFVKQK
ncbi:unnamed protein product [Cuscuta campestris]|uniref:Uncharacterized protein n=1 Tax=Cuscuta campestris TaxID=132261 RepID=A0A484MY20_9ASTE|nr:unnamed protein product [Cuscuta campestris]